MKTHHRYECEICGALYHFAEVAEVCESEGRPPEIDIVEGDSVSFKTRYDGVQSDVVTGVKIAPYLLVDPASLEDFRMDAWRSMEKHKWVVVLKEEWQFGKDYYSREVFASEVTKLDQPRGLSAAEEPNSSEGVTNNPGDGT